MTLIVSGRLIRNEADLSDSARLTLAHIDFAPEWLGWVISSPAACYDLPDEATLVVAVQQGLHGSPLTLLPKLDIWVSPVKLMSLGVDNLRTLARAEGFDASDVAKEQAQRLLAEHRLVTAERLRSMRTFLQDLGIESNPLFQVCEFNDQLDLHELAGLDLGQLGAGAEALRREAAQWAVEQARTVPEFCDYVQVYLAHARNMQALEGSADTRAALAHGVLEALIPLAFATLDCPQLSDRLPSSSEVGQAMRTWLAHGKMLGFRRPSHMVLQLVTQAGYTTQPGSDAHYLLESYLSRAREFLGRSHSWESQLGQDGATVIFTLNAGGAALAADDHVAQLQLSADRVLSLRRFGARQAR
ncbi:hypothetical protein [Massilia timonae]|uniref:hypothetical protein n=1 Tax=Massilia timonae TaxID=47229 RepID=UPI0028D50584|nr:hypothetical protein [Massilia timonae]